MAESANQQEPLATAEFFLAVITTSIEFFGGVEIMDYRIGDGVQLRWRQGDKIFNSIVTLSQITKTKIPTAMARDIVYHARTEMDAV